MIKFTIHLTPDKLLNILIYRSPVGDIIYESYKLLKMVQFLALCAVCAYIDYISILLSKSYDFRSAYHLWKNRTDYIVTSYKLRLSSRLVFQYRLILCNATQKVAKTSQTVQKLQMCIIQA